MFKKSFAPYLVIFSMSLFSIAPVIVRYIDTPIPTTLAYQQLFYLLLLSSFLFLTNRKSGFTRKHSWKSLVISSIVVIVSLATYYLAIYLTTIPNTIFTNYTAPVFAFVLSIIFLKEKFEYRTLAVITLSLFGVMMIFYEGISIGSDHILGILIGLLSGCSYGLNTVINKYLLGKGDKYSLLFFQGILLVLMFSPFLFVKIPSIMNMLYIFLLALVFFVGSLSFFKALSLIDAKTVSAISFIEVIFVIGWAILFFGTSEIPGQFALIGGLLIILPGLYLAFHESKNN